MSRNGKYHGRVEDANGRHCNWPNCDRPGEFRAPRSRREVAELDGKPVGEPFWFCLDHVREYNAKWDYLKGLSSEEIDRFQLSALAWHRPTWSVRDGARGSDFGFADPLDILGAAGLPRSARMERGPLNRPLRADDYEALAKLGLDGSATAAEVKGAYKELVKRYHPDRNRGEADGPQSRLREVIDAYAHLSRDFAMQ